MLNHPITEKQKACKKLIDAMIAYFQCLHVFEITHGITFNEDIPVRNVYDFVKLLNKFYHEIQGQDNTDLKDEWIDK